MARKMIPLNEEGRRINEGHHNCTIPDEVVTLIRDLREQHALTIPEIARKTGVNPRTVKAYCEYTRRGQVPRDWKIEEADDAEG